MAAAAEAVAQAPVSAQVVGNAFVQQYYHILHHSPGLVYRFYQDISKLGRPEEDGSMSITTTMQAINEKIVSLNYGDLRAEIKSVDALDSFNGGVDVLVTGYLTGKDNTVRNFTQSFFLAPQDRGYFVLNDLFRYVDSVNVDPALAYNAAEAAIPEPVLAVPVEVQENLVSEVSMPPAEEAVVVEVYNPPENGDAPTVEEVPVAEVVDEVEDDAQMVVESSVKIEELPKKSYASIVMHAKQSVQNAVLSPAAPRRVLQEQLYPTSAPATDGPAPILDSVDNGNNQEADGYSIYIKGLPMNATETLLEEVFKKFGTIKSDGIQVRSNRQQAFCFGFVEFEEASSVQKAIEASPITIGARQALVEEKRSTNSRGNSKGRYQSARSSGFRNDVVRGRGNYGGGRGAYNRGGGDFNGRGGGDFNGRGGGDFNGRGEYGGIRGSNRSGYNRSENVNGNGPRLNRAGGVANGNGKSTMPRVPATA